MAERVLELAAGDLAPAGDQPWPDAVRGVASRFREVLLAHPGVLGVVATRPVNSPEALRMLESGPGSAARWTSSSTATPLRYRRPAQ